MTDYERRQSKSKLRKTINLGNYESARVDVGLETDVADETPWDDAYDKALKIVKRQLDMIIEGKKF